MTNHAPSVHRFALDIALPVDIDADDTLSKALGQVSSDLLVTHGMPNRVSLSRWGSGRPVLYVDNAPDDDRVSTRLSPEDIETALRTLADLWSDSAYEPSRRQHEIADLVTSTYAAMQRDTSSASRRSTRACPICLRDLPDSDDAVNDHYDREHPSIDTDTAMPADAANLICRMVRDECFRTFEANGKAMPLADYVADVVQHLPDHDTSQEVQQP
jgi:hypothetical protein